MQLIHEQETRAFQQAIWLDEETDLYYEIIRGRGQTQLEVYIGTLLADNNLHYYAEDGKATPILKVIDFNRDTRCGVFEIRKGMRWQTIRDNVLGYVLRVPL